MKFIRNQRFICVFLLAMLLLQGCTHPNQNPDATFRVQVGSILDINGSLEVSVVGPPPYGWDSDIEFRVRNMSSNPVSFATDLGSKLFVLNGGQWQQVLNRERYLGQSFVLAPAHPGELTADDVTSFAHPALDNSLVAGKAYSLRIFVEGRMLSAEGNVPVGAYVDVKLSP